jgi:hypothetical protein
MISTPSGMRTPTGINTPSRTGINTPRSMSINTPRSTGINAPNVETKWNVGDLDDILSTTIPIVNNDKEALKVINKRLEEMKEFDEVVFERVRIDDLVKSLMKGL